MNRKIACGLFLAVLGIGMMYFVLAGNPHDFMRFFAAWVGLAIVAVGVDIVISK